MFILQITILKFVPFGKPYTIIIYHVIRVCRISFTKFYTKILLIFWIIFKTYNKSTETINYQTENNIIESYVSSFIAYKDLDSYNKMYAKNLAKVSKFDTKNMF